MKNRAFIQLILCLSVCLCTVNLSAQIHVDSEKDVGIGTDSPNGSKVKIETDDEDKALEVIHNTSSTAINLYGIKNTLSGGTSRRYGFDNKVTQDLSSNQLTYGFRNQVNGGIGFAYGYYNQVNTGTGKKNGFQNEVTQAISSSKEIKGFYNLVKGGTGIAIGFDNDVRLGTGTKYAFRNRAFQTESSTLPMYAFWNEVGGGAGNTTSFRNRLQSGAGVKWGIDNGVTQESNSSNDLYGFHTEYLNLGTGETRGISILSKDSMIQNDHLGIENYIEQGLTAHTAPVYGMDNNIEPGPGYSEHTVYGVKALIPQIGDSPRFGLHAWAMADEFVNTTEVYGRADAFKGGAGDSKPFGIYGEIYAFDNIEGGAAIYGKANGTNAVDNFAGMFDGNVMVNGVQIYTSDERIKTNIRTLASSGLSLITGLRPVTYKYDRSKVDGAPDNLQYGFIAQEVERVLPEIVTDVEIPGKTIHKETVREIEDPDGGRPTVVKTMSYVGKEDGVIQKAMNYNAIIPILVKAVQEQQETIKALEKRVEELEKR